MDATLRKLESRGGDQAEQVCSEVAPAVNSVVTACLGDATA